MWCASCGLMELIDRLVLFVEDFFSRYEWLVVDLW